MSDLITAVTIIKDNLDISENDTARDGGIGRAIREAISLLKGKRYWFLRKNVIISHGVGTSKFDVPTDFAMMDSFDLLYGDNRYVHDDGFDLYEYQTFKRLFMSATTFVPPSGQPMACALLNKTLMLDKALDRVAHFDITYFCQDTALPVNPTDTSIFFGDDSFDVVVSLAEHIFQRRTMQDKAADELITQNYQQLLFNRHEAYDRGAMIW